MVGALMSSKCCKSYRKKGKSCKNCPVVKCMNKKQRKKFLNKFK